MPAARQQTRGHAGAVWGGGSTRLDISSTLEGRAVFSGSPDNRWGVGVGG